MSSALLLITQLAGPGMAEVAPGLPPWSCVVMAARDASGCTPHSGNLATVKIEPGEDADTFRPDGRLASRFAVHSSVSQGGAPGLSENHATLSCTGRSL